MTLDALAHREVESVLCVPGRLWTDILMRTLHHEAQSFSLNDAQPSLVNSCLKGLGHRWVLRGELRGLDLRPLRVLLARLTKVPNEDFQVIPSIERFGEFAIDARFCAVYPTSNPLLLGGEWFEAVSRGFGRF
jgi:hypothetical protein